MNAMNGGGGTESGSESRVIRPPAPIIPTPPPPGYPGPGYAAPGPHAPYPYAYAPGRTSGLAIASLVLGIVWVFWIGSILAVIFGHVALSQVKRSLGAVRGRGLAIAGLVLGYLGVAMLALFIVAAVALDLDAPTAAECTIESSTLRIAETAYFAQYGHFTDERGLVVAGFLGQESDLYDVVLVGGGPSTAPRYAIVATDDGCA
jgi:hypothetical protein